MILPVSFFVKRQIKTKGDQHWSTDLNSFGVIYNK